MKNITPFAKKVYRVVLEIPLGQVRSYKWVARRINRPRAARAIGQALRSNPLPLIIPCHRVICSDGRLGGYRWGIRKKQRLLDIETKLIKKVENSNRK